jgi:hypothetical protein
MIPLQNDRGQAMVEASATLGLLVFVFVCAFYLFLLSIDKIRSLDAAYHLARAQEVGKDSVIVRATILAICFGRPTLTRSTAIPAADGGPAVEEAALEYIPDIFRGLAHPWTTRMRVATPEAQFLKQSWPLAPVDHPAPLIALESEKLLVKTLAARP